MEQDYIWEYNPPEAKTDGRWEQEVFRTLYTTCLKASNDLWRMENNEVLNKKEGCCVSTRDDEAIIIADAASVAALQSLSNFKMKEVELTSNPTIYDFTTTHVVGTLERFTVKRNILQKENKITVMWRGKTAIIHVKGLDKSSVK